MEDNAKKVLVEKFEEKVHEDLFKYLKNSDRIDAHVPQCPDVEDLWPEIARAYIPDGAKEFEKYPVVSLGWVMFIGMAMAYFWDENWEEYAKEKKFYERLREGRGYDNLDETVLIDIMKYEGESVAKESAVVADCASRVYSILCRENIEAGTDVAFGCWIAAIHQLYLAGMAMELKTLGYHMTPLGEA